MEDISVYIEVALSEGPIVRRPGSLVCKSVDIKEQEYEKDNGAGEAVTACLY